MKLNDLLPPPSALIADAFNHPSMRVRPRAAQPYPTVEDGLKAAANAVENALILAVSERVKPLIENVVETVEMNEGPYADAMDPNSWEQAADDLVEAAVEEYVPYLSADWLGNHTINSKVWDRDGVNKFCMSLGLEMYRQLVHGKTPAQILSAAGIVRADIESALATHNQTKEDQPMDTTQMNAVVEKMAVHLGKDYDVMAVYDDIDLASDDDEILAAGAGARLGIEDDDLMTLQMFRMEHGDEATDKISEMLKGLSNGIALKKPKPGKAAKTKVEKSEPKDTFPAELLMKHKVALTFKDADMAQQLGVSRATYNNWVNGKQPAVLSGDQYSTLRMDLIERINALHEVLGALDSVEPEVFF